MKHVREVEAAAFLAETLGLGADDRCGLIVPISHAFGLTCMHASIAAGAEGVLVESSFSPAPLLRALEAREATVLHGSPTLFRTLLKARPDGIAGVRTGLVAGAPCPPDLLEALDERGTSSTATASRRQRGHLRAHRRPGGRAPTTSRRRRPAYEARVSDQRASRSPGTT